ncbi:MAG: hypothetical protein ACYS30_24010 [Planctomycetota bacterium]|jgi:hypothetical protein
MKKSKRVSALVLCCLFVLGALAGTSTMAATPEEIEASIDAGIEWLVAQQDPNTGYFYELWDNLGGMTGLALIKLEERAFELGYDSPFDPNYPYSENVEKGLAYLFSIASTIPIYNQVAGNPDSDGDGIGVYVTSDGHHRTYETGIALMAIAASDDPDRIVNSSGSPVNGWTYKQVMDDMVDYLAFGQVDSGQGQGGWGYTDDPNLLPDRWADNSNTGYAVLGLAYAEAYGFNCTIPQFVKNGLNIWIDYIQNDVDGDPDDGGSGYTAPWDWVNILKTGNLIFEMAFYGDGPAVPRVQDALNYLGRTWNDPSNDIWDPGWGNPAYGGTPHYQAMYCIMKGLEYRGIDTITVDGNDIDWYAEFAEAIVNTQDLDPNSPNYGSWPLDYWGGKVVATAWALLTLEKAAPPVAEVYGQCIVAGESFEPVDLDETIDPCNPGTPPYTWTVTGNVDLVVNIDVNNVMTIAYPPGWTGSETLTVTGSDAVNKVTKSYPTYTVCAVPVVMDIPDQTTPFESFDLDDYLDPNCGLGPNDLEWSASEPPEGWTVEIDVNNVVTVTVGPNAPSESANITFTATSIVCDCAEPSDSDDAAFSAAPECIEAYVRIAPRVVNRKSWSRRIMALVYLPEGIGRLDIDRDEPLVLSPGGIQAYRQWVFGGWYRRQRVRIFAFFDKAELMNAVPENGWVELTVEGRLKSGQCFYSTSTIRIIEPPRWRPWWWRWLQRWRR